MLDNRLDETMLHPSAGADADLPLAGITVIDLSHVYNGPYATFLMALSGATVIKVEPFQGETLRSRGDMGGAEFSYAMLNSNKRPVTLNLKSERGCALLKEMVARADVIVENFKPGVMDRLGVGAAVLQGINPRLIYASSSGYGKTGPYREFPAMDLVMQAMCGIIDSTGYPDQPPVKSGAALCDFLAGIHLYGAVLTALYEREHSGRARVVEVSMQDAAYCSLASNLGMLHARGDQAPARTGNRHGGLGVSPYNVYPTTDGYVVINSPGDTHFRSILEVMGRSDLADDPRFRTRTDRVRNIYEVDDLIEEWTRRHSRGDIAQRLLAVKVPCSAVRHLREVIHDENMHARGSLQWVDHPDLGRIVLPHSPFVFEGTGRRPLEPSLPLGACNDEIFGEWLGHSPEDLASLRAAGAIS